MIKEHIVSKTTISLTLTLEPSLFLVSLGATLELEVADAIALVAVLPLKASQSTSSAVPNARPMLAEPKTAM